MIKNNPVPQKNLQLVNATGSKIINTEYLDGFQYSTPNIEPIRKALEEKDDITVSATKAGNEEAFLPLEDREIALAPGNPDEIATILSFFPTAEGYYDYENFRYIYQYKDHLGNVRVSFVKNSAGGLSVMDTNDYYPFGLSFMKPFGNSSVYDPMAIPYNYKYQGQELQETGWYSFKWRNYMPDVGRFFNIDPLAEKFPYNSTYAFSENAVISYRELEGLEKVLAIFFTGGFRGEGKSTKQINQHTKAPLALYNKVAEMGRANGVDIAGGVYQTTNEGLGRNAAANNASEFVQNNYQEGDKIVAFGFSHGGNQVIEFNNNLADIGIKTDASIIVDSSGGGFEQKGIDIVKTTVNNSEYVMNIYQPNARKALEEPDDATMSARTAGNEEAFLPLEDRLVAPGNPNEELPLILSFFPTAEGYYNYENFRYIYQYKDHLGNVRVSFLKNSAGDLQVMDTNDYYPFGLSFMKPVGNNSYYDPMAIPYNYKYNGKELQETGMYDYGFRQYMPDIGRWISPDPLAELAPTWTPYRYAYDNPLRYIDPKGLFESRKEARVYRREHDIGGSIKRQKDGSYAINDKSNHVSYTKGEEGSGETFANDGVQESALVIKEKSPYGGKDALDLVATDISLFENISWKGMSTAQKSKLVWDSKKVIETTTGFKVPGNTSSWYRSKLPKAMKGIGVAGGAISGAVIVYDVVDSKQVKASNILDAAVTGVSFVPGWGWVVGGVYFGADMITKGVTGESIGQHLDNAVEENFNKDDGALIDWSK